MTPARDRWHAPPPARTALALILGPGTPPGPLPDLLAKSGRRAELAAVTARALGPGRNVNDLSERDTAGWPDPYGPDPVVFGPGRRTAGN